MCKFVWSFQCASVNATQFLLYNEREAVALLTTITSGTTSVPLFCCIWMTCRNLLRYTGCLHNIPFRPGIPENFRIFSIQRGLTTVKPTDHAGSRLTNTLLVCKKEHDWLKDTYWIMWLATGHDLRNAIGSGALEFIWCFFNVYIAYVLLMWGYNDSRSGLRAFIIKLYLVHRWGFARLFSSMSAYLCFAVSSSVPTALDDCILLCEKSNISVVYVKCNVKFQPTHDISYPWNVTTRPGRFFFFTIIVVLCYIKSCFM